MTAPSSAPLAVTTGTTTSTTDLPYTQLYSLGDQGFKADVGMNAHQLSGSVNPTASTVTIPLGSLSPEGNILYDAKSITLVIANNAGVDITSADLQFTDTIGSQSVTIDYHIPDIIANDTTRGTTGNQLTTGNYVSTVINLDNGVLKNVQLSVTFASTPTSGSVSTQANLHSHRFVGAMKPRPLCTFTYSQANSGADFQFTYQTLRRGAIQRTFTILNTMDQATGAIYFVQFESTIFNPSSYSAADSVQITSSVKASNYLPYTESLNSIDNAHAVGQIIDSVHVTLGACTTAATKGNVQVFVSEVLN